MDSPRLLAARLTCALTWTGSQVVNRWWVWSQGSGSALLGALGRLRDAFDREDIPLATPLPPTRTGYDRCGLLARRTYGCVPSTVCGVVGVCSIPGTTPL